MIGPEAGHPLFIRPGVVRVCEHVRDLRGPAVEPDPADERSPVQEHGSMGDEFLVLRRHPGAVCEPVPASIHQEYLSGIGTAELPRGFEDRFKYSLKIRCGSSDDGKNLARRSELLAHLSKLITQPFGLGCHSRIDGRVLIGRLSLVPLDHSASPLRGVPKGITFAPVSSPGSRRTTPPNARPHLRANSPSMRVGRQGDMP